VQLTIKELIKTPVYIRDMPNLFDIIKDKIEPLAPHKTPQASPITSHNIEDTLSEFFIKYTDIIFSFCFKLDFFIFITWQEVMAKPIISDKILNNIKVNNKIMAKTILLVPKNISENKLNTSDRKKDKKVKHIIQNRLFILLPLSSRLFKCNLLLKHLVLSVL